MQLSWCLLPIVVAALATAVPSRAEELALRAPVPSRILRANAWFLAGGDRLPKDPHSSWGIRDYQERSKPYLRFK